MSHSDYLILAVQFIARSCLESFYVALATTEYNLFSIVTDVTRTFI